MTLAGLGIATAQTGQSDAPTTTTAPADGARAAGPHGPKPGLAAAAGAIGVSEDELRTALRSGQSIAQVAQSKGVDVQKVIDAVVADARTRLAEKVQAGDLTQAQADEIKQRRSESGLVLGGGPGGHGPGRHGPGGPGGGPGVVMEAAAKAIGITEAKLFEQLRAGETLEAIADANGKSYDDVKSAVRGAVRTELDAEVKAGRLTRAQATDMLEHITQHLEDGDFGRGPRGGPGGPGPGDRDESAFGGAAVGDGQPS
jgi:hypothetical protein